MHPRWHCIHIISVFSLSATLQHNVSLLPLFGFSANSSTTSVLHSFTFSAASFYLRQLIFRICELLFVASRVQVPPPCLSSFTRYSFTPFVNCIPPFPLFSFRSVAAAAVAVWIFKLLPQFATNYTFVHSHLNLNNLYLCFCFCSVYICFPWSGCLPSIYYLSILSSPGLCCLAAAAASASAAANLTQTGINTADRAISKRSTSWFVCNYRLFLWTVAWPGLDSAVSGSIT